MSRDIWELPKLKALKVLISEKVGYQQGILLENSNALVSCL